MEKLNLGSKNRSKRNPLVWTARNTHRMDDIKVILNEMADYLPITLRTLFYRLISKDLVNAPHWHKNKGNGPPIKVYAAVKRLMKWGRIEKIVPADCIIDKNRILTDKRGFDDMLDFINYMMSFRFRNYDRCLAQDQPRYTEIWIEKAALLHLIEPVADEFCLRVLAARGYDSISFQINFLHRVQAAINKGQIPTVIYWGDWDPSGENMIYAAMQTMKDEMDLTGVEYYRGGINPEHFDDIQANPVPINPKDPRSERFVERHGTIAYELDAFHPKELQSLVRESIEEMTDVEILEQNKLIEIKELGPADKMDGILLDARNRIKELVVG